MKDEHFRGQQIAGADPLSWLVTSNTLRRAATVLQEVSRRGSNLVSELAWRDQPSDGSVTPELSAALGARELYAPALSLLGGAIECRLKAYLAMRGHKLVDARGQLKKEFGNHELRKLAESADMGLSEDDLRILDGLKEFVEWLGRYPIPKSWERMKHLRQLDLGSRGGFSERAFALATRIFSEHRRFRN